VPAELLTSMAIDGGKLLFFNFSLKNPDNLFMKVSPDPIFFPKVRWE
jgi:hypothetical protein